MKKQKSDEGIEMFYGFWKYLGLIGGFLFGIILVWWGGGIMLNDWIAIRTSMGPLGNFVLIPFTVGIILSSLTFVEFIRIIRKGDKI